MALLDFIPENDLERAIVESKQGRRPLADVLERLVRGQVYVLSRKEVQADGGGFEPLLVEQAGYRLVVAYSSLTRTGLYPDSAPYTLQMPGDAFFARMPPGYGVVLNQGYVVQLAIQPEAVSDLKASISVHR